jgi:hypothetical protein
MRDRQKVRGKSAGAGETDPALGGTVDQDGPPGLLKVMAIGALVIALAFGAVRFATRGQAHAPTQANANVLGPHTASPPQALPSRTWDLAHLGPNAVQKCAAFRKVLADTRDMQAADGGTISAADATHLQKALSKARAMTPDSVTAPQCGVPL